MNSATFIGRVTSDTQLRETTVRKPDGTPVYVANVTIVAENRKYDGSKETDLVQFALWREQAASLAKYLKKGKQIAISGDVHPEVMKDATGKVMTDEVGNIRLKMVIHQVSKLELLADARGDSEATADAVDAVVPEAIPFDA